MSDEGYPPRHHVLRDLPFEIEVVSATQQRAHLAATGAWSVGALATVVLVVAGAVTGGFRPYWAVFALVGVLGPSPAAARRGSSGPPQPQSTCGTAP